MIVRRLYPLMSFERNSLTLGGTGKHHGGKVNFPKLSFAQRNPRGTFDALAVSSNIQRSQRHIAPHCQRGHVGRHLDLELAAVNESNQGIIDTSPLLKRHKGN